LDHPGAERAAFGLTVKAIPELMHGIHHYITLRLSIVLLSSSNVMGTAVMATVLTSRAIPSFVHQQ